MQVGRSLPAAGVGQHPPRSSRRPIAGVSVVSHLRLQSKSVEQQLGPRAFAATADFATAVGPQHGAHSSRPTGRRFDADCELPGALAAGTTAVAADGSGRGDSTGGLNHSEKLVCRLATTATRPPKGRRYATAARCDRPSQGVAASSRPGRSHLLRWLNLRRYRCSGHRCRLRAAAGCPVLWRLLPRLLVRCPYLSRRASQVARTGAGLQSHSLRGVLSFRCRTRLRNRPLASGNRHASTRNDGATVRVAGGCRQSRRTQSAVGDVGARLLRRPPRDGAAPRRCLSRRQPQNRDSSGRLRRRLPLRPRQQPSCAAD